MSPLADSRQLRSISPHQRLGDNLSSLVPMLPRQVMLGSRLESQSTSSETLPLPAPSTTVNESDDLQHLRASLFVGRFGIFMDDGERLNLFRRITTIAGIQIDRENGDEGSDEDNDEDDHGDENEDNSKDEDSQKDGGEEDNEDSDENRYSSHLGVFNLPHYNSNLSQEHRGRARAAWVSSPSAQTNLPDPHTENDRPQHSPYSTYLTQAPSNQPQLPASEVHADMLSPLAHQLEQIPVSDSALFHDSQSSQPEPGMLYHVPFVFDPRTRLILRLPVQPNPWQRRMDSNSDTDPVLHESDEEWERFSLDEESEESSINEDWEEYTIDDEEEEDENEVEMECEYDDIIFSGFGMNYIPRPRFLGYFLLLFEPT